MKVICRLLGVLFLTTWGTVLANDQDLDLLNVTLIDGSGAPPRSVAAILVRNGRIAELAERTPPVSDARRLDLKGKHLLPGFVDAHTHIQSPASAQRALESGVTTARVLGDEYRRALGTRDLIRAGYIRGPDLRVSSSIIRPQPGEAFFLTYPEFGSDIAGRLQGPERIAAVTRRLLESGVDVIKISASERAGLPSTDPRRDELTEEEMRAAVVEAKRDGKYVAVHAHSRTGIAAAVRAGVRSIEHGTYMDDETLKEMRRLGTFFVPTLAVMSPLSDPMSKSASDVALQVRTQQMLAPLRENVRKARALGVVVAVSTDGSYGDGDPTARIRIADDMVILVRECGFSPLEAITAGTFNGARVLGVEQRTGTVRAGMEADLVVVERDPLRDVTALYEPILVIADGRVVVERP